MLGRKLKLLKNAQVIAGMQTKTFSFNAESVDTTTDDEDGSRLLDENSGVNFVDISGDGITKTELWNIIAFDNGAKMFDDVICVFPAITQGDSPAILTSNFRLSAFENSGAYNEAVTFSFSLESSNTWTYQEEGATTDAIIFAGIENGEVVNLYLAYSGATGTYASAPSLTFTGDGTGAAATTTINGNGQIDSITLTNSGSGYTTIPDVSAADAAAADYTSDVYWQNLSSGTWDYSWDGTEWTHQVSSYFSSMGLEVTATGAQAGWQIGFRPESMELTVNSGFDLGNFGSLNGINFDVFDSNNNFIGSVTHNFSSYNETVNLSIQLTFAGFDIDRIEITPTLYNMAPRITLIDFTE